MIEKPIGLEMNKIHKRIGRHIAWELSQAGFDETTIMHGWMLSYIEEHEAEGLFQKDFEEQFQMAKSTVTCILKMMEQKGYITRTAVEKDARLKSIHLTPLGREVHENTVSIIQKMDEMLEDGITDEEREVFFRVIDKMYNNMTRVEQDA